MKFIRTTQHSLQLFQLEDREELMIIGKELISIPTVVYDEYEHNITDYYAFYKDGAIKYLYHAERETKPCHAWQDVYVRDIQHSVAIGHHNTPLWKLAATAPDSWDVYHFSQETKANPIVADEIESSCLFKRMCAEKAIGIFPDIQTLAWRQECFC